MKIILRKKSFKSFVMLIGLFIYGIAISDILLIDKVESKNKTNLPIKSQTMEQVIDLFGKPITMSVPVGDPPITKWTYKEFIVYFEHSHVITSVIKINAK